MESQVGATPLVHINTRRLTPRRRPSEAAAGGNSHPDTALGTLYLIDGHSHLYRAYYAIRNLSTASGVPTNAIYGMTSMLLKLLREHRPDYLAIAFDSKGPTMRHEAYADYKANRPAMPDELSTQLPYLDRLIDALGLPRLSQAGYEADDIIATLAVQAAAKGLQVVIVSSDKDLYQLITPHIALYDSMKDQFIRRDEVVARFGVEPQQMAELLGLMGDQVDNVPGVPGVGAKTAAALVARFGTIEQLLDHLDQIDKPKLRETLRRHADQARLSRELVLLHTDCPVDAIPEQLRPQPYDTAALRTLLTELEFTSLLNTLTAPDGPAVAAAGPSMPPPSSDLSRLWPALASASIIAVSLHTGPSTAEDRPVGLGVTLDTATYYVPWGKAIVSLCDRLTGGGVAVAGHDLKPLLHAVAELGVDKVEVGFDTQLAAYLLDPTRSRYELAHLAATYSVNDLPAEAPAEPDAAYCGAASRAVWRLLPGLRTALEQAQLLDLFESIELPLIEVLTAMERRGIRLDTIQLGKVGEELHSHLSQLERTIFQLAGTSFNLNSPKQLADILFNRLGLTPLKKTKTGYSTDESVLSQLALQHELPAELINYRQLTKLLSTYVEALPELVNTQTGRLHTTFHQTVAATGRLSSSDPNLQNIPIRGEWGHRIRQCFVAAPGCRLISADYNQIELRLLAHLSQDPNLLDAFRRGEDVHAATGAQLFGLPAKRITPEMRRAAKTVNFAVIYGMSAYGLSQSLGIPQADAKQYIERYFSYYHGVKRFTEETIAAAAREGSVTTLWHRRRPIPELSQRGAMRAVGERAAVNTVVQGSAADLIKMAMNRVFRRLRQEQSSGVMLLQIHDELLLEAPEADCAAVADLVRQEMEGVADLSVPLTIDLGVGSHWADAH